MTLNMVFCRLYNTKHTQKLFFAEVEKWSLTENLQKDETKFKVNKD